MSQITVSPQELIARASQLEEHNQSFFNAVSELENLEGTLNSMWDGEANNTFHSAFASDKIQMTNFYNAINQYVQVLREIASRYQQAESANTDTARTRNYQ